jgi:hypothetical protein
MNRHSATRGIRIKRLTDAALAARRRAPCPALDCESVVQSGLQRALDVWRPPAGAADEVGPVVAECVAGRGQAADGRGKGAGGGVLVGPGEEAGKDGVSGF